MQHIRCITFISNVSQIARLLDLALTLLWPVYIHADLIVRLDDRHCPLFRTCEVNDTNDTGGLDRDSPNFWRPMPRIKGRS